MVSERNSLVFDYDIRQYEKKAQLLDGKYGLRNKINGAIVMNCNPFTKGHRYLIEIAKKYVDTLLLFIVEEDKSYYKFEDRKRMVELGVEDMNHVIVLPSGKLILSSLTMPEYFHKEQLQDVCINPIKDVELFASVLAPMFNISYRFIGEEPFDKITAQYNCTIKEICSKYKIKAVEIPRLNRRGE